MQEGKEVQQNEIFGFFEEMTAVNAASGVTHTDTYIKGPGPDDGDADVDE